MSLGTEYWVGMGCRLWTRRGQ